MEEAAFAPDLAVFLVLLAAMGLTNLAFQSMANASVEVAVDSRLRGRVTGLYMLTFIGGTPIGAPLIGVLTSHFGARAGMAVCGVVPVLAAVVVAAARRARRRLGPASPRKRFVQNFTSRFRGNVQGTADSCAGCCAQIYEYVLVDAATCAINLTLPSAISAVWQQMTIKRVENNAAHDVIIRAQAPDAINGVNEYALLLQNPILQIYSNGHEWRNV